MEGIGEIDAVDLLEELGLDNVLAIGRGEVQFSCPFTEGHAFGDAHPSAHLNEEKLVYRCKACGRAGTALDLVGATMRLNPVEAIRWLRDRYGDGYRPLQGSAAAEMKEIQERWKTRRQQVTKRLPVEQETIAYHGIFDVDWDSDHEAAIYMRGRGFSADTMRDWQIGYDTWSRRVTIPVRDVEGKLIGFKGRAIDPGADIKYNLLGDLEKRKPRYGIGYGFDMHDPVDVIFGLDRVVQRPLHGPRRVVGVEGELNAIAMHAAGVTNTVGIGTTTITLAQQRLLRWYADELVLFYDTDEAGHASTWGYYDEKDRWRPGIVDKLSPYMRILIVDDHEDDPASMTPECRIELVETAKPWLAIAVA